MTEACLAQPPVLSIKAKEKISSIGEKKNEDLGLARSPKNEHSLSSPISILPFILYNSCKVAEASLSSVNDKYSYYLFIIKNGYIIFFPRQFYK